jgi:hypothetical protein
MQRFCRPQRGLVGSMMRAERAVLDKIVDELKFHG